MLLFCHPREIGDPGAENSEHVVLDRRFRGDDTEKNVINKKQIRWT